MPKTRPGYAPGFRQKMAELVRAGHTLEIHGSGLMHPAVQTLVYH